ncbi:MAG: CBU_0592 family membrane protein [Gaiellaceae bacterium]
MAKATQRSAATSVIEAFAWVAVVVILVAYALVSFDQLESDGIPFQLMNLIGAAGIATISFARRVFQPTVLNATWAVIALVAIVRIAL